MAQLTQDKLRETKYYLDRVTATLEKIKSTTDMLEVVKEGLYMRYDLNSFINSSRAVTLVLQKEFRRKYDAEFDNWYALKLQKLKQHGFSEKLKELRNMNQKEGNKYPTLELITELEKVNLFFELDYTQASGKTLIKYGMFVKGSENLPNAAPVPTINSTNSDLPKLTEEDKDKLLDEISKEWKQANTEALQKNNFRLHKLKVDILNIDLTPQDFLRNCIEVFEIIRDITKESSLKFK